MINQSTFDFLQNLSENNNRDWFAENKTTYQKAQENILQFVEQLIAEVGIFDEEILKLDPKKTLFRIYKDTRFSKDKTPYKTNFGAALGMSKGNKIAGYYLHIEPKKSFLAGGVYQPESGILKEIRKEISMNGEDFLVIINDKNFKKYFGELSKNDTLVKVPQGFEKTDKMADFLKLKSIVVMHHLSDDEVLAENSAKNFAKIYHAMKPLNDFLSAPFQ